jgi:nucleotide-binding universal stress UspA family protein
MYNTILVPLDGSKRAETILPHVEQLARRYTAKVIFLKVVGPFTTFLDSEVTSDDLYLEALEQKMHEAESYLSGWQDEFREKGISAERSIAHGLVVETIIKIAKEENVDLIAIASHGRTGLSRVFYGSIASGLLHSIDRPLLLIRSRSYK